MINIREFEIDLVKKLSEKLDESNNWETSLSSLKHKTENITLFFSSYNEEVSLFSPKYDFTYIELTEEIHKKAKKIHDDICISEKAINDEATRKKIIEFFGLNDQLSKLENLKEYSEPIPETIPETITEPLILPKKKKKFWFF
jgi:predicted mannosyl-3-phosphoglycerate phosphatase (HAD superfamily)